MAGYNLAELHEALITPTNPITKRMRAVFYLRTIATPEVVPILVEGFSTDSQLLQHEICYVLGQIHLPESEAFLISALQNETLEVISRHEAAEALGAIGNLRFLPILQAYSASPIRELAETCQLAIDRINWLQNPEEIPPSPIILSIDPAPKFAAQLTIPQLKEIYHDTTQSLFNRYRALFSLRDIGTDEAVLAICEGFGNQNFSALFQHEIAFVLGQMQEKAAAGIPYLIQALEDTSNHYITRHEAAEAIGSITDSPEALGILEKYKNDPAEPVRSSCFIALDISEYWFKNE
ncbi:unnamed protein product [Blepharisma stoltei]|uniref:Deoxyhypusine hydroxylase n=1 Tax=Blepharisma stoltei TaxID=1481888 RepID=A0AAU9JSQ5_9CILI|nr:unnamed protein product [Blepharisma stoltei]